MSGPPKLSGIQSYFLGQADHFGLLGGRKGQACRAMSVGHRVHRRSLGYSVPWPRLSILFARSLPNNKALEQFKVAGNYLANGVLRQQLRGPHEQIQPIGCYEAGADPMSADYLVEVGLSAPNGSVLSLACQRPHIVAVRRPGPHSLTERSSTHACEAFPCHPHGPPSCRPETLQGRVVVPFLQPIAGATRSSYH